MCGAFGFTKEQVSDYWISRYELDRYPETEWGVSFNIRPTQTSMVVVRNSPNHLEELSFGINPSWNEKMLLINAQSEGVATKFTFRKMFRESRCLIPADVFYEWKRLPDGKQPYAFSLTSGETFSFAGIHNGKGFVILTTVPNSAVEDVHNRMPVILNREDEDMWLNPDTEPERLLGLLRPYPADEMKRWAISSLVNSAKNNFREILTPVPEETS